MPRCSEHRTNPTGPTTDDDKHRGLSLPSGNQSRSISVPPAFITLTGWRNIIGVVGSTLPKSDLVRMEFNQALITESHFGQGLILI